MELMASLNSALERLSMQQVSCSSDGYKSACVLQSDYTGDVCLAVWAISNTTDHPKPPLVTAFRKGAALENFDVSGPIVDCTLCVLFKANLSIAPAVRQDDIVRGISHINELMYFERIRVDEAHDVRR
jgi:hypothetical protein